MGSAPERRYEAARWILETCDRLLEPKPRSIALFGSFARDDLHETSDVDLLLVGDAIPRRPFARTQWFFPVIQNWRQAHAHFQAPFSLSPLFMSQAGWKDATALQLSLSDHAWILKDDGFLSDTLHRASLSIQKGEWSKRTLPDGGWLWIPRTGAA